jgi:SAM-dependent methyltransferase
MPMRAKRGRARRGRSSPPRDKMQWMSGSVPSPAYGGGFSAALADVYDDFLVPLIFEPYADDVIRRLTGVGEGSVLEVAAGTGAVTRRLATALPDAVAITATDLMQPMLDRAVRVGTARPVRWQQADVMELPFESESFDAVVCQFGVMFFNPKADAFAEIRRVLRPSGRFVFSVWGSLPDNEHAAAITGVMNDMFAADPPTFLERVPYGYHDADAIVADLRAGGFEPEPTVERVDFVSTAASATHVATAFGAGTPLRDEIEARTPTSVADTVGQAADALAKQFGSEGLTGAISAQLVTVTK